MSQEIFLNQWADFIVIFFCDMLLTLSNKASSLIISLLSSVSILCYFWDSYAQGKRLEFD